MGDEVEEGGEGWLETVIVSAARMGDDEGLFPWLLPQVAKWQPFEDEEGANENGM